MSETDSFLGMGEEGGKTSLGTEGFSVGRQGGSKALKKINDKKQREQVLRLIVSCSKQLALRRGKSHAGQWVVGRKSGEGSAFTVERLFLHLILQKGNTFRLLVVTEEAAKLDISSADPSEDLKFICRMQVG